MRRIGIMSMQRVKNYGSFLQAFALKKILEDISQEEVSFVDFHTEHGIKDSAKESLDALKKNKFKYQMLSISSKLLKIGVHNNLIHSQKVIDRVNLFEFYDLYCKRFEDEFWSILGLNKSMNYSTQLDVLVIGSDEVFNYVEAQKAGYSDELFGYNQNADSIISFAGSFGCTRYEDLKQNEYTQKLKDYFIKFNAISVRDRNSKGIIEHLIGKECAYHLDPVLHFDYSEYMPNLSHSRPYLAVYAYSGLAEEYKEVIRSYAQKHNLEILCFMGYQNGLGKFMNVSPFELLAYMKDAECIVTTTFHGSVFSVKYNKRFCAIVQHRKGTGYGNDEKLGDLLNRVNLSKKMIDRPEQVEKELDDQIEYSFVNEYVSECVQDGIDYLKENVILY